MKWSFSAARAFRQCQRSWFFKNCLASPVAADSQRRAAYLLSKLQSVSAWRGRLVDKILSERLVPALGRHHPITKADLRTAARTCFDRELDFALNNRIHEPGLKLSQHDAVAAFRAIEYGDTISPEEIAQAWHDIETAIENLFKMNHLRASLKHASYVVAQRSLQFKFAAVTVVAVPDVIAFTDHSPPLIVDWKVHSFGTRDYRLQLALYALALSRCAPHKDFPPVLTKYAPTDYRLLEAQLLAGAEHKYTLDSADFDDLEDYVAATATEMLAATDGLKNGDLSADDFAVTEWPDLCQRCPYQRICWERADDAARNQYLFDC